AHDAGGDSVLQAERIADGDHEIPDFETRRVAQRHLGEARLRDFEHGDVRGDVAADDGRGEIAAVLQRYGDFGRVINHMRVCNDVPVFRIKDDTGAGALE